MPIDFTHLHVHTEYSLLDGLSHIDKLIERVKANGQKAVAITDHGVMYGVVHFYNQCKKAGIKPIIGLEAYMSEKSRFDKQARMGADQYHITLLAKDNTGYKNLMKLVSLAHLEGFSYKPRIDFELLTKHREGLIATSGCSSGIIPKKISQNKPKEAVDWLKKFQTLFEDDFYIEIQSHPAVPIVETTRPKLIELSKKYGVPLVATNDVHYVDRDDAEAQDALLAIQTRKTIEDENRLSMLDSPDFYLKSSEEMANMFPEHPESIENTAKIADKCNVEIQTGKMIFPNYPLQEGETTESALKDMTYRGAANRFETITDEIKERIEYELDIINQKGYASYFLIVQDFVNWAKDQGIAVGPGRGSAAGSLVSYCIEITDINPLAHGLAFERFLNPERPSPPDIDIDIADVKRDDVIRYTAEAYGEDHVAQVITFGTMEARAAIRDIGRVLGMPYSDPDKIAKLIPPGTKIKQAIEEVSDLKTYYESEPRFKKLLDLAQRVEGSSRHHSVHAAAVIIADKPLTEYTPVQIESKNGKTVTQYDMYALDLNVSDDAIGLLKMDFLGLRNLSILQEAINFVKQEQGVDVKLGDLPLDNKNVYDMLSLGETTGVFQMESAGMRRVARNLKPERFSDITAMLALYRPGPMELIDDFIAGKEDQEKIHYPHPDLKPVLEETYGIPVYQEQVLQIANVFAGYSLGEADILRRAIGKKKISILNKEKKRFVKGAEEKGYSAKKAEEIWGFIEKFAGYGFNKAHSAAYAMIAYQTAYMKANYPVEYMTAFLTIESQSGSANSDEKVSQAVDECKRLNIEVLPPDINKSRDGFTIEEKEGSLNSKAIRFGLSAIKNVGDAAVTNILEVRDKDGDFNTMTNFCSRVDNRKVNKKVLESLIRAGAYHSFGKRSQLLSAIDDIRDQAVREQERRQSGQTGIFDFITEEHDEQEAKDPLPDIPEIPKKELLKDEKELLGVYITDHPLSAALRQIDGSKFTKISQLDPILHSNKKVRLAGLISRVKQVRTRKRNKEMAFATLEDSTGSIEMVIFPKTYEDIKHELQPDIPVIIRGKFDRSDDRESIILDSIEPIKEDSNNTNSEGNTIKIPRGTDKSVLAKVGEVLKSSPGDEKVTILIPNGGAPKRLELPYGVAFTDELKAKITTILTKN